MHYPKSLTLLIEHLKKLPGVGRKTAERYAFKMLEWKENDLHALASTLYGIKQRICCCDECGCFNEDQTCQFCQKTTADSLLCIVAYPKDVYPIHQTHLFKGYYHVLGGLLSPLEGKGPDQLHLSNLTQRIEKRGIREVILALDSTLNGDATTLYLARELSSLKIKITKLASGLPLGSSLDFIDEGTLSQAFYGRHDIHPSSIQVEI